MNAPRAKSHCYPRGGTRDQIEDMLEPTPSGSLSFRRTMEPSEADVAAVKKSLSLIDLHPCLEEVIAPAGLDRTKLSVAIKLGANKQPNFSPREDIPISDGTKGVIWRVTSLRTLFRGDKTPPAFKGEPPPDYMPLFFFIEDHVLTFCGAAGPKTDGEFEEAYSNLRRRPDGKPLSPLHTFLWQAAAGLLGRRPVSAAEFDGIFGRLALSASHFRTGLVSRNYVETLNLTMGRMRRR
jgi:hypothetical protein